MTPYFTTSARPERYSRSGSVASTSRSISTPRRLPERADHVLGRGQVDAHLAADAAIDLGQERRGNLNEGEPAGKGGGDEAGQIAHHAAADRDDRRLAIGLQADQFVPQPLGLRERLARFAGRNTEQVAPRACRRSAPRRRARHAAVTPLSVMTTRVLAGNRSRRKLAAPAKRPRPICDVVAAVAALDRGRRESWWAWHRSRKGDQPPTRATSAGVTVICRQKPVCVRTYSRFAAGRRIGVQLLLRARPARRPASPHTRPATR